MLGHLYLTHDPEINFPARSSLSDAPYCWKRTWVGFLSKFLMRYAIWHVSNYNIDEEDQSLILIDKGTYTICALSCFACIPLRLNFLVMERLGLVLVVLQEVFFFFFFFDELKELPLLTAFLRKSSHFTIKSLIQS